VEAEAKLSAPFNSACETTWGGAVGTAGGGLCSKLCSWMGLCASHWLASVACVASLLLTTLDCLLEKAHMEGQKRIWKRLMCVVMPTSRQFPDIGVRCLHPWHIVGHCSISEIDELYTAPLPCTQHTLSYAIMIMIQAWNVASRPFNVQPRVFFATAWPHQCKLLTPLHCWCNSFT